MNTPTYAQMCVATMEPQPHPFLGLVLPDPIGQILGTGYWRFQNTSGIGGLAKWTEDRLDILAVHADAPGTGQFRRFIADAKLHWSTICIWEDWNPMLGPALKRYGFSPETEIEPHGGSVSGWRWDKPQSKP